MFVRSGRNTTEKKEEEAILHFIPLSIHNAHSGNSLSHSHNYRYSLPSLSTLSLRFSTSLYPSRCNICFLPCFTDSCTCVCVCAAASVLFLRSMCLPCECVPQVFYIYIYFYFRCLISTLVLIVWVCFVCARVRE